MTRHIRIGTRKAVWPLVVLAALLFALGGAGRMAAAADCQFVLGFQALHAMIPDTVGDCVENEQHHPGEGVTHQRTTNGPAGLGESDQPHGFQRWLPHLGRWPARPAATAQYRTVRLGSRRGQSWTTTR